MNRIFMNMHKPVLLLSLFFFTAVYYCNAQVRVPGMKWQKHFGGSGEDWLSYPHKYALIDRDGQYLVAASSNSTDGDVTGNHAALTLPVSSTWDIWVAKLDTQRNVLWNVSLGGPSTDMLGSLQMAHDSGYIITGEANLNGGDVSGIHGNADAWVVRLGNNGKVVWQKCLGGSNYDVGNYIVPAKDGYILVGSTASTDGNVTGRHGTVNNDDIWVVKLDKSGNIMWQKCLGGSNEDFASVIKQTADGGYILAGSTSSNDGDVQGLHGEADIWVVKLTASGAIEWQKCLGGTRDETAYNIEQTATGGYLVAGMTNSFNGDVTGYHTPTSATDTAADDAWVVSLSSTGNLEWQRCFGGTGEDVFYDLQIKPDKTVVAVGRTSSTDGDVSYLNDEGPDCWVVNFNSNNGNIIWGKSFGTSFDHPATLALKNNGNIIIAGNSYTTDRYDDIWLFEAGAINTIAGRVFYDSNSDGIQNNGESAFDKITIRSGKNGDTTSAIPQNGYYTMDVDTGTYSTKAVPYNNYYTIVPATKTSVFNSYFNTDSVHFAVQPLPGIRDVNISMIPLTPARPGFNVQYKLLYANAGTNTVGTGYINLVKDSRLTLTGAIPAATSVSGDTIKWYYSNLAPNTETAIMPTFSLGTSVNPGDTLKSIAFINQDGTDITPVDDTITLKQMVRSSLDPNDKTEANAGIITPAQVSNGDYLNYLIRFQNTGTDTAFNVIVRDTLESRLDWSTLQMVSASHPYQLTIEGDNKLSWQFNGIKLPFDEPSSHGYIAYRIKPLSTVHAGDTIKNTAGIYFDFNLPVATNINKTIVFLPSSALPVTLISFDAAQAGSIVNVSWKTSAELNAKYFEVQRSANGIDFTTIGTVSAGNTTYLFKDNSPIAGYNYYRLKPVDIDGRFTYSTIVMVNMKSGAEVISSLYPNPGNGNVTLKLQGTVQGNVMVQVLDQQGREVTTKQFGVQNTGEFKTPLDLGKISKGSYVLRIVVDKKVYLQKLLIQ